MIPYLFPRESSPILAMTKPPVKKWVPKPGEEIEVAMSLSGMFYRRYFVRMEGGKYICVPYPSIGAEWAWRCAWPIKRANYTPPNVSAAQAPVSATIGTEPLSAVPPDAADPDGWIAWKGGECPLKEGERAYLRQNDGYVSYNAYDNTYFPRAWRHDPALLSGAIIAYKVLP